MRRYASLLVGLSLLLVVPGVAFALTIPAPSGPVSDVAGMLSPQVKETLTRALSIYEASTTNSVVVVTISSLEGDSIENVAADLFKRWGIGQKKKDNGVLLLIARDDQALRIEVGYGLEPVLTDAISSRIIREVIVPYFKQNDYDGGVVAGVNAIVNVLDHDPTALPEKSSVRISDISSLVYPILFSFFFVFSWLGSILARSKSWWGGGVVGGVLAAMVTFFGGFYFLGLTAFAILVPIGLLLDFIISREYQKNVALGKTHPWWMGGPWGPGGMGGGFSGRGGGGFGGFGGGMSGGGGASGRW